ncbi:PQQ-binding-like beta-propeller repeat protein [Yinghuangia seranimata]|uniref:outer membrane protein assembly factor BamB family protein n=1 Tax=Yinghuangia seranimata TaxID=408067 RepID=UPI00248B822F|nr:PQQ-binding-like beta-propeller repeat protein [Yinghuangia seranimata]MDI2128570.1 PQQ-binding-like beta-propeller repeat protein [Yinghuangia seranimata]
MRELEPGDPHRLGDHEVVGILGTGGFGRVYVARAPHDRRVTIKLAHPHLLRTDPHFADRFADAMTDLSRVRNLGAGRIVQWDAQDIRPWYARRYVPGASLTQLLAVCGTLPLVAALRIVAGAARGVAAMHDAELPHGGVTPGNVLVTGSSAQLVDGGLARMFTPKPAGLAEDPPVGALWVPLAGPALQPPEREDGTRQADLYGLGVLLVLALTGRVPSGADDLDGVPSVIAPLAAALLGADAAARPQAAEVEAELEAVAAAERPDVASPDFAAGLPKPARRVIAQYARPLAGYGGDVPTDAEVAAFGARVVAARRTLDAQSDAEPSPARQSVPRGRGRAAAQETVARTLWKQRLPGVRALSAAEGRLFAGGEALTALDGRTGQVLWSKPGWRLVAEPAEGQAYCAQGTRIARVDAATGAELWRADVAAARGLWARGTSRLSRAERAFRLHAVNAPVPGGLTAVGGHSELFGLDPETGAVLWHRREPRRSVFTRDGAGAVYLSGDGREPVRALDPETGELMWRDDAEDSIVTSVDRGFVLCARFRATTAEVAHYVVRAAGTGKLLCRDERPGDFAVLDDSVLYILGGGQLRSLCPASGAERWALPWRGGPSGMAVASAGGEAYLRGDDRRVHGIDLVDGTVRWVSDPVPAERQRDPVGGMLDRTLPILVGGDMVCVRSHGDPALTVLDRATGAERWRWRGALSSLTMVDPAIAAPYVYVPDGDEVRALTL